MSLFTKESLERLKGSVDLVDVLSPFIDLKKAGAAYKAHCPFHEEKTPSFVIQRGDTHYHCFGCGAHGDAIQFLMQMQKFSFVESVEWLGEKFHVQLEKVEQEEKGVSKTVLKEALETAKDFFHCYLLTSEEGLEALSYLLARGLDLAFVKRFEIGLAPKTGGPLCKVLHARGFSSEVMKECGLLSNAGKDFFKARITFPIRNASGSVIGFSARKFNEATYGGKYINSPETPLFKKSRILFGLHYSRRRIAQEKRAILVEGQIDCLKMIEVGLNCTVATLGTALGEEHVKELMTLGVREVFLLFDGDLAGQKAASKSGNLFQKKGVAVKVITLPSGMDPDLLLRQQGPKSLVEALSQGKDYLTFQTAFLAKEYDPRTPEGKAALFSALKEQISQWEDPILVHESLRKVGGILNLPSDLVGSSEPVRTYIKRPSPLNVSSIDPHRILELDCLRWLILTGSQKSVFVELARKNLTPEHFWVPLCRKIYQAVLAHENVELLSLLIDEPEEDMAALLDELMQKKINKEKAEQHFPETVQKLLDRQWMQGREEVKRKIHQGGISEAEILALAKEFDALKKERPLVIQ